MDEAGSSFPLLPVLLLTPVLFAKFKVSGHSMLPVLKPNQQILVSSLPYFFSNPKIGDIIAFKSNNIYIIKRIREIQNNKYLVKGDNPDDSKEYGWIDKNSIEGRLIIVL